MNVAIQTIDGREHRFEVSGHETIDEFRDSIVDSDWLTMGEMAAIRVDNICAIADVDEAGL